MTNSIVTAQGAVVCVPEIPVTWEDTDFIMRKILNPIFHAIAILLFLAIAIIYFVLPPLRDLVGNILTSLMICLIIFEIGELITVFTRFTNHVSFLVAGKLIENKRWIHFHKEFLLIFFFLDIFRYYI